PYIDACASYAENYADETARRLKAFFAMVKKWRLLAGSVDLGELCRTVFDESGLYDACGALPGGRQRQANLDRLVSNAAAFDQNNSSSLTRFLAHVEKLRARGDGDDAHILGENDDVVRLMTVHKSKGLEFPVVFGAMMERKYSRRQASEAVNAHRALGLGAKYCDPDLQTRRKTLPQQAIIQRTRREDRAEELRILYVLLTRARDRLILVGSERDIDRADIRYRALKYAPNSAESYFDVIMPAVIDGGADIFIHSGAVKADAVAMETASSVLEAEPAGENDALLRDIMWVYPESAAAQQPLKLTVTGLLREIQQPDRPEEMIERPAFMSEKPSQMSASERGTAYHRVLQFMDMNKLRGLGGRSLRAEITRQADEMKNSNRISAPQRACIREGSIAAFYEGELGRRMLASGRVEREWPFNVMMRVSEALSRDEAGIYGKEEILVQGVIDCCFEEGGQWVLLDYKTSRELDSAALTERYFSQLRMYALALERITGMPVKEISLCLLLSGEHIPVDIGRK
ncbi:MAG: PD-(D/E)XK nuclease family protein, partial [Clostridia bacterium]|nr:PD-(D/E)XK nuclease family protein [Clostridia bacterium]